MKRKLMLPWDWTQQNWTKLCANKRELFQSLLYVPRFLLTVLWKADYYHYGHAHFKIWTLVVQMLKRTYWYIMTGDQAPCSILHLLSTIKVDSHPVVWWDAWVLWQLSIKNQNIGKLGCIWKLTPSPLITSVSRVHNASWCNHHIKNNNIFSLHHEYVYTF